MGQNFVKMYKTSMANLIELIEGKQQATVVSYIIRNINLGENLVIGTQREIAAACGVSTKTVNEIFKALAEKGFLKKKSGAYMLSPDVFYRGSEQQKFQSYSKIQVL
ncbi:replication protein (RepL) [Bacillus sp. OV166]|uniref:replication/maintenance protein RepL n=1 Tax=Bacillus sp. OV166 TaxID=1882763 RepID=UPI000A2AD61E|nr:replication/maintenance protein RepL [Bacillus sp. OV166]SMQ86829.1 replication protein (RepL) [Bacillus sp. OV166]